MKKKILRKMMRMFLLCLVKYFVKPVLKVSRIFNTYVITNTGCINPTIRKYNTSGNLDT